MRVVLFTNLLPVYTALQQLRTAGWLMAVVCADNLHGPSVQLKEICRKDNVTCLQVTRRNMQPAVLNLLSNLRPDAVLMLGFTYRIPAKIYQLPRLGFYNVHFSLLPAYRGPDPIFHQLKNGEQTSGVTIHKVDAFFDTGDIVAQQPVPLIPGETWGLCVTRHIHAAIGVIADLMNRLNGNYFVQTTAQNEKAASYQGRISAGDTVVNWNTQLACEIENLVNACNPAAGGAVTFIKQQPVRIFEVSQVDGHFNNPLPQPGTVVHAGADGLFVQCLRQQLLRINILGLNEGVVTGAKFAAMGVKAGDCFEMIETMQLNV